MYDALYRRHVVDGGETEIPPSDMSSHFLNTATDTFLPFAAEKSNFRAEITAEEDIGAPKTTSMEAQRKKLLMGLIILTIFVSGSRGWTGEIHGRVICDVCGDSSIGPEDHVLEGAEVAVLCITRSGEVLNYQAFTNSKGIYTVAETMSESDRWDACLARPISSFHEHCTHLGANSSGVKFSYNRPSGHSHTVRPFVYRPSSVPTYCI